jgi:hypothetical protein
MKNVTQKQIDKMKVVSLDELAATKNALRNYVVYIGRTYGVMFFQVHVGLASTNHLDAIKIAVENQPIFKVLVDTRKMK